MNRENRIEKTPQQKKAESLAKDRRYAYGNSPHGARNARRQSRQRRSQHVRRAAKQVLGGPAAAHDEALVDAMEDIVLVKSAGGWRKVPDVALGLMLERRARRQQT